LLSEGQIFDNTYRIVRLIGEGGMGVVYEAIHARLAGRYAIKVLLQKLCETPEALSRFDREARITSLLQHPNVVQVIDYNTAADGTEYLVMEYLAGENLERRLFREARIPLESAAGIVEQIAAGLAAAHVHGIVHRDLKPDNVFLVPVEGRQTETVKILDFGISQAADWRCGQDADLFGTPQYMSPEQVEGRVADVDSATDQFGLAVVTYEMLTGRNPFLGATVAATFSRISHADPGPTGMGRGVDLVVSRGMAKSKRERFPCVTDFANAFREAVARRAREASRLVAPTPGPGTRAPAGGPVGGPVGGPFGWKNSGSGRGRNWGLGLVASLVVAVSTPFVAVAVANRRSSVGHSDTADIAVRPAPAAERFHAGRQMVLTDQVEGRYSAVSESRINQIEKVGALPAPSRRTEPTHEAGPLIVPLPLPAPVSASPPARPTRSRQAHRTLTPSVPSRHARNTARAALLMDDDATLPLDEKRIR
jgi:tRNA A-37 threonylcarbamoyl transferase component Bud32